MKNDIIIINNDVSAEKEQLLQVTIKPFLEWFKYTVLELHQTTAKQKIIRGLDASTGLLASAIVVPLGYEFGILLSHVAKITNKETQQAIGYYFATTATGSAAVLVGRVSNSVLEQLLTPTPEVRKALRRKGINFSEVEVLFDGLFQRDRDICINTSDYHEDLLLEKTQTLFNPSTSRDIAPQKNL